MNLPKKLILLVVINLLLFTMAYYYYNYMVDEYKIYIDYIKSNIVIDTLGFEEALAVKFGSNKSFNSIFTGFQNRINKFNEKQEEILNRE